MYTSFLAILVTVYPPPRRFPPGPKRGTITLQLPDACPPGPPRKSLKNQLVSGAVFPPILGPKMGLKMAQNRASEAPKTLLKPRCCWKLFSEPFWALFGPSGTSKIELPLMAGARFSEILPLAWGSQNRTQNEPKIVPQTTPRGLQIAKNQVPNRCFIFKKFQVKI